MPFKNVTNVLVGDLDLKNIFMHISYKFFSFESVDRNQCKLWNRDVRSIEKKHFFNLIMQCVFNHHDFIFSHLHFFIRCIDSIIFIFFRDYFVPKTWFIKRQKMIAFRVINDVVFQRISFLPIGQICFVSEVVCCVDEMILWKFCYSFRCLFIFGLIVLRLFANWFFDQAI